ncbi:MAG TPA: sugar phosphate isomerase/epimerase family protein [Phycisphaerae bacterium]|jgi:sugar phosphate isomerase/epimerase|nr:sugar phosphate isomerase/epimerase [Phycisphaerae bacterium]HOB76150.1 sugar phosphate isomerase/epimerase family protein [Phycisphaerae bacterium]HOJ56182.1 sugar phosphate isomerase/epimerase family protein [Phycisphaerae bacterium]HOL28254.1 sugar phosphate isomerase/epimerase family protein [Phycisphaerae bacterium]HPP22636.1 sugar phosphate isomerase/epimerase family protein [Phycisphaerae bacterium]
MRFATCNEPWKETPIEEVFRIAARLGFEGVELAPFTLAERVENVPAGRRREILQAARDTGIQIVGLHWLLVSPKGLHLTTPDAAVRQQTADYLKALADFCGDLGGKVMIFGSPNQRSVEAPTSFDEAWKRARDLFASCADHFASRDVTLCIEALSTRETNFINTAAEAARMADEIGHPNIDIMLDMKAMSAMPDGVEGTIRQFARRAKHIHANEPSGKSAGMPPAQGDPPGVDFKAALKALADTGYDRWVSLEPFDYNPDPTTVAETGLRTLKEALRS